MRPLNPHVRRLNPETERILGRYWNFEALATDDDAVEEALLQAFPLVRERVARDTLHYLKEDPEQRAATTRLTTRCWPKGSSSTG